MAYAESGIPKGLRRKGQFSHDVQSMYLLLCHLCRYGPDRPKVFGPLSEGTVPSYLSGGSQHTLMTLNLPNMLQLLTALPVYYNVILGPY